jgi:molecular chaperone GrpE (heat shock protein)
VKLGGLGKGIIAIKIAKKFANKDTPGKMDMMDPQDRARMVQEDEDYEDNPYTMKLGMVSRELMSAMEAGDEKAFGKYLYKAFDLMSHMQAMGGRDDSDEDDYM